ncbi:MAG TPA: hypothetical protein VK421_06315 [Pyrinomonadaceae bacterium]|nr:hypothetical protein [Pyrinomonadaceae bacterium]
MTKDPAGGYWVASNRIGVKPHHVTADFLNCDCEGHARTGMCYHIAAARMAWEASAGFEAYYAVRAKERPRSASRRRRRG